MVFWHIFMCITKNYMPNMEEQQGKEKEKS